MANNVAIGTDIGNSSESFRGNSEPPPPERMVQLLTTLHQLLLGYNSKPDTRLGPCFVGISAPIGTPCQGMHFPRWRRRMRTRDGTVADWQSIGTKPTNGAIGNFCQSVSIVYNFVLASSTSPCSSRKCWTRHVPRVWESYRRGGRLGRTKHEGSNAGREKLLFFFFFFSISWALNIDN